MPRPSRLLPPRWLVPLAIVAGCGERSPAPAPPPAPTSPAPADDVKIMTEYWEGTDRIKFRYELRKGADGRYARNGFSQAFYLGGGVEREGTYRNDERVGVWKYYDPEGRLLRTEDRPDGK